MPLMSVKYFGMYYEWRDIVNAMTDEDVGKALKAALNYDGSEATIPHFENPFAQVFFSLMRSKIDGVIHNYAWDNVHGKSKKFQKTSIKTKIKEKEKNQTTAGAVDNFANANILLPQTCCFCGSELVNGMAMNVRKCLMCGSVYKGGKWLKGCL